jgi:Carboxypeptidase regulatory-like domain
MRALIALFLAGSAYAASIEGRVIQDDTGEPLPAVELKFHQAGARELAADLETDGQGRFQAESLPGGEYRVEISKAGFVSAEFPLRLAGNIAPLFLRLVRCGVIAGQATDARGRAVPPVLHAPGGRNIGGASVSLMVKTDDGRLEPFQSPKSLDDDNHYRFYDLPPGEYAVALAQFGLSGTAASVQLYPENAHPRFFSVSGGEEYKDIDFSIQPVDGYHVSGSVTLPKPGKPFGLTLVSVDQPMLDVARTLTDEKGAFRFDSIASGSYYLFVSGPMAGYGATAIVLGPGPQFARTRVDVAGQNVEGLAIAVHEGATVGLTLKAAPAGACPKAAAVSLRPMESWGAFVDRNGQAAEEEQTVRGVAPGRYRVVVTNLPDTCFQRGVTTVDATSGDGHAAVELAAPGSIRGVLRGAAQAADYAVLLLPSDREAPSPVQLAFPDSAGRFAFSGLRPGRYRIAARPAAEASRARWLNGLAGMVEIEIPGGEPTDLELPVPVRK